MLCIILHCKETNLFVLQLDYVSLKNWGGWGGGKEIRKIAVVRETLIKMFLVYPWGKRRAPTFI